MSRNTIMSQSACVQTDTHNFLCERIVETMKTMKKIMSLVLAVACMMSLSVAAFAADSVSVGETVTADAYVDWKINWILDVTAHLTDPSVPPTQAPSDNAVLETPTGDYPYQVTITLENDVLALTSIDMSEVKAGDLGGTARILSYTTVADSYRAGEERISSLTVGFSSFDEEYVFTAEEYANAHSFVSAMGQVGEKDFALTIKVTQ